MKEKFERFMVGRYGIDQLSIFLTYFAIFLLLVLFLLGRGDLSFIALLMVLISYLRVFSRNKEKRYRENSKFLQIYTRVRNFFIRNKRQVFGTKTHKYFTCKNCKTQLRVPKKKGKIKIKCPKCGEEYIKRT